MVSTASSTGAQSFSGRSVTLDFGTGKHIAQTVVSDTSVTSNQMVLTQLVGTDETAILDGINVMVMNYVPGTGYTIVASSPNGSVGQFTVNCQVIRIS
jgi:hypothetical protein